MSLAVLAVLAALLAAPAAAQSVRERELTSSGAWSWFGDPRSVYFDAPTAAPTPAGCRPAAARPVAATTTTPACGRSPPSRPASRSTTTLNPSILVRPDGRLLVLYLTHAGDNMWYRRSARPEDITAWEPERVFPTNTPGTHGYTYPNPLQLSAEGNRIYLFWRGGNFNPSCSRPPATAPAGARPGR